MSNCNCDFVKYSPICGEDGNSYISPCHAGCTYESEDENSIKHYGNCSCIHSKENLNYDLSFNQGGKAKMGSCPIDCHNELILFMIVMCTIKFFGSTSRASNFLISVRSVHEDDKTVSMGIVLTITAAFAFIPSPIFVGWVFDQTCTVWGKTCTGTGNCWLYDGEQLRYMMNLIAASAVSLGVICDVGVWYLVRDLKIFDDDIKEEKEIMSQSKDENNVISNTVELKEIEKNIKIND